MSMLSLKRSSVSGWDRSLESAFAAGPQIAALLPARQPSRALLPLFVAAVLVVPARPGLGQGGATMSAGQSMQNSANSAAGQTNRNIGAVAPSIGAEASTPPTGPSGPGGYSGSAPYPGDYSRADPSSGYPSGPPGALGAGRGGMAPGNPVGAAGGMFAGSIAEFFNRPLSPAESFQPTLYEQAALAAHQGDQRLALALFHAHLLAERDSAAAALGSVRFSPMLRRPVWALRLGVSINTRIPPDLVDDPQPVRDGDKKPTPGNRADYGMSLDSSSEPSSIEPPGSQPAPARPAGRAAPGTPSPPGSPAELGGSLEQMSAPSALPANGGLALPGAPVPGLPVPGQPGMGPAADAGGLAAKVATLDRDLGLLAEVMQAELSRRIRDGKFGPALAELTSRGAALADKLPPNTSGHEALPLLAPGIEFVGNGIAAQVIETARASQIDLLVHFEVIVKPLPRSEETQYQARCRVVNVATGDTLGASKLIDRREVTLAARRSNIRAVVDELLQPALQALDSKGAVAAMPTLKPQQALARIDTLLAGPRPGRLINLAEMAMFQHLGLIDEDQLQQAVYYAAGDDGLLLLLADYDQRREIAQRMVAKELGQN